MGTVLGRLARLACALLAAPLFCGCLDATQVEVELTTDVNCADRPETTISVGTLGQLDSSAPVAVTTACDAKTGRIGSIVVLPHESKEGQVGIEIVAGIAKGADECRRDNFAGGCIVARRSLNFVKHHGLQLPIELEAACVDVPCGATETCRKGACVSAEVDPNSCFTSQGCSIVDPQGGSGGSGGSGGYGGAGVGGNSGAGVGGSHSGGAGPSGGATGGGEGQAGDGSSPGGAGGSAGQSMGGSGGEAATGGQSGSAGQTSAGFGGQGGASGQASAGFAGQVAAAGQASGGFGGQGAGGSAGQAAAGTGGQAAGGNVGQTAAGTGGQAFGGSAGQTAAGAGGQAAGGAPPLGPVLVASDFKASTGSVLSISPTKALLPEHPGDILFAWVCVTSDLGFASPQDSTFWSAYTNAPGQNFLLAKLHCQVFTATATGGSESHAFNVFPSAAVTIQRLEFASAKPPPASPPSDSGFPTTTATTSSMTVSQNHSALVYFFGVSGSTTLGAIKLGVGQVSTPMQQITAGGVSQLTSGIAVAYDQPPGTAPKVTYAPASTSVWSSAGVVLSPSP